MEDKQILKMESLIGMDFLFRENNFTSGTSKFEYFKMVIHNKVHHNCYCGHHIPTLAKVCEKNTNSSAITT